MKTHIYNVFFRNCSSVNHPSLPLASPLSEASTNNMKLTCFFEWHHIGNNFCCFPCLLLLWHAKFDMLETMDAIKKVSKNFLQISTKLYIHIRSGNINPQMTIHALFTWTDRLWIALSSNQTQKSYLVTTLWNGKVPNQHCSPGSA